MKETATPIKRAFDSLDQDPMARAVQLADNLLVMTGHRSTDLHNAIGEERLKKLGLAQFYDIRVDDFRLAHAPFVHAYTDALKAAGPDPKNADQHLKEALWMAWCDMSSCWQ
jgi:hypothetical protein